MAYMECIEVWKAECECGEAIAFPVEDKKENDIYKCVCGKRYIIDRTAGHYHEIDSSEIAELVEG